MTLDTTNALLVDVSKYNGMVKWPVAKEHGVVGAGMRASISYAYADPYIYYNMTETLTIGMYRLPYHVLYPGESPQRQIDNFLRACGEDWTNAWPVLDIELHPWVGKSTITNAIVTWATGVEARIGKLPLLYSTASWINEFTWTGTWRSDFKWWLAHYLNDHTIEKPAPPARPYGVIDWQIHQNSDKIIAWDGFAGADGIKTVDYNRWNGPNSAVDEFFGNFPVNTITCPNCGYEWQPV